MAQERLNCWEFMKCGREPGGAQIAHLGVCPAAADISFDGIHLGKNAGRICWAVAGTFCGGKVQGSFAEKRASCISCDFFQKVQGEEGTANLSTKFLRFISKNGKGSFLKNLTYKSVRAGERFISQGETTDRAYVIERGSCLLIVEKDHELHPVRHLGEGDIVGELTLLTGEPQNAHVEALTDMDLWGLSKGQFDDLSERDPEVLDFLTELVADRFDSKRPTADRAIGKYVATDVIGSGGYSIVYKGYHSHLNMPVAIKMMRHNLALSPDFLNTFRNEARTIARFNHESIVKVYDIEERYRTVFIIMELVQGESLKEMIQRLKGIPPSVASNFLVQICSGLCYAHEHNILHQDVNPTNILVQQNDRLKILDFGLACPPGADDRSIFDGTLQYMAPEQIVCKPVDERTDIYSLGVTAYEMITGKLPFLEDGVKALMDMHTKRDIPDPAEAMPFIPKPLRQFIIKACHRDPSRRYKSVDEGMQELLPLAREFEPGRRHIRALNAIEILVKEHGLIRQFLDNLSIAADMVDNGDLPPKEFFERAVQFARVFADKYHHYKEEHLMFTQLAQKKAGALDGAIESLRFQHERGRNFISEISSSLEGYAKGNDLHITNLLENVGAYIHLLRHHIHKEDHHFFPMAREVFTESELQGLGEMFEEEGKKAGQDVIENNRKLVEEMGSLL